MANRKTRDDLVGRNEDDDRRKREREYAELKAELDRLWRERRSDSSEHR